jgi:DNA replication initiation complex subunit (GINS family)
MYNELYNAWKLEFENNELEKLPPEFYSQISEYVRKLREEGRMLDKRTLKTTLLKKEMENARIMVHGLIQIRYRKIVAKIAKGEEIPQDSLTPEEKTIYSKISPSSETIQTFAKEIIRGQTPQVKVETERRRAALRFLQEVPAIIGADMKTYGPFKIEDVAALPIENTKILTKQGLAEKVETS